MVGIAADRTELAFLRDVQSAIPVVFDLGDPVRPGFGPSFPSFGADIVQTLLYASRYNSHTKIANRYSTNRRGI